MEMKLTMKAIVLYILLAFIFTPTSILAHGDHAPLTDKDFIGKASFDVSIIVDNKEPVEGELLDESWKKVSENDKQVFKKTEHFVIVSFYNREKKRTLFVLLTEYIKYLGANFSGAFEGV